MRRPVAVAVVVSLNIGILIAQEPVCRSFVFPSQGVSADGRNGRHPEITIPGADTPNEDGLTGTTGIYPVIVPYPVGATRVGLEFWNRTVWTDVPPFSVSIHGLIDRADHRVVGGVTATDNAPWFHMDYNETRHASFALSTVLNAGEAYVVGFWNENVQPVNVQFVLGALVCFPTRTQMNAYIRYVEP